MTIQAQVDLLFDPRDLHQQAQREVLEAARRNDTVQGALERAAFAQHVYMIKSAREDIARLTEHTPEKLILALDYAWQAFMPRFVKISGPQIALAYGRALKEVKEGVVDPKYIDELARAHAQRLSLYFHETSREAVVQGFSTYVNRKVPARAAADRALMAYGVTPRQMSGLTSNTAIDAKIASNVFQRAEAKALNYIATSLRQRIEKFAGQEEHNLEQQAEQIAWMWMVENDQVPRNAEKIWVTAKDEKVCPQCGPMHGKVALVTEQYVLPNGIKVWVPGPHPNCRCKARFRIPRQLEIAKARGDDRYDRDQRGRFSAVERRGPRFKEPEQLNLEIPTREREELKLNLEEINEVLEEAQPETPKIDLTPQIDLGRRISLGNQINLNQMIDISAADTGATPKINLSGGKISNRERSSIDIRERFNDISLARELTGKIELAGTALVEEAARRAAHQGKYLYRNTVLLGQDSGTPIGKRTPYYRVFSVDEEMDPDGRAEFNHDQTWTRDPAEVSMEAVQWRRERIHQMINQLNIDNNRQWISREHPDYELYVQLDEAEVEDLVGWVAERNTKRGAKNSNAAMEVSIYSLGTDEMEGADEMWEMHPVPYSTLAELFDLDPAYFNIAIAAVSEGHDSELGRTDQRDRDLVTLSGQFETTGTHRGSTITGSLAGEGDDIVFYHLDPADVETEAFDINDRPDGWPE